MVCFVCQRDAVKQVDLTDTGKTEAIGPEFIRHCDKKTGGNLKDFRVYGLKA